MNIKDFTGNATGKLVPIVEESVNLWSFVPDPIPRKLELRGSIMKLVESAGTHLGRLFGAAEILNPWLRLFLTREAIASNKIEGTITTARQLYLFGSEESGKTNREEELDRKEVLNYVKAMDTGVDLLKTYPLALNTINKLHAVLLDGVRGQDKLPGQLRKRQNAISKNKFIDAKYIPPPASEVLAGISDIEKFIHEESDIPNVVKVALVHYQFEAVHPYLDGNGRLGRLLIPLLLSSWEMIPLGTPRLYLSDYFEEHNNEYGNHLLLISQNGEWDAWIEFFLKGVIDESQKTWDLAHALIDLQDRWIDKVSSRPGSLQTIVRKLFDWPVVRLKDVEQMTGRSRQQAGNYARELEKLGILKGDGKSWGQTYFADDIFRTFFGETNED
jgi:Fic family protein